MPSEPRKDGTGYRSSKEEAFEKAWGEYGYKNSDMTPEFRFHPERRWRFDFAWPSLRVAVEVQGFGRQYGGSKYGRAGGHDSPTGLARDAEKIRAAISRGWTVIPFTSSCLSNEDKRREAVEFVCDVLSSRATEQALINKGLGGSQ